MKTKENENKIVNVNPMKQYLSDYCEFTKKIMVPKFIEHIRKQNEREFDWTTEEE